MRGLSQFLALNCLIKWIFPSKTSENDKRHGVVSLLREYDVITPKARPTSWSDQSKSASLCPVHYLTFIYIQQWRVERARGGCPFHKIAVCSNYT